MRRPALHHPHTSPTTGWAHPYAPNRHPGLCYADGGDDQPPTPAPATEAPKPAPPAGRVFTQDEVAALAAKEKSQGERAGARKALEDLAAEHGFTKPEDIKDFITAAREAQQAQLTEQEKREQALAEREAKLADREAQAAARERAATRRSVLVGLGATGDDLEDAAALLRVPDDADETALAEAAEKLKERRPELFGARSETAPAPTMPPAPGGSPAGGPPARHAPAAKPGDRGREMARLRGHKPAA